MHARLSGGLFYFSAVVCCILAWRIHTGLQPLCVENGFAVALDVLKPNPAAGLISCNRPFHLEILIIFLGFQKGHFLVFWLYTINMHKTIITCGEAIWPALGSAIAVEAPTNERTAPQITFLIFVISHLYFLERRLTI